MTNEREIAKWFCAGCGKESPNRIRVCDCPTNVVIKDCIGSGSGEWKLDAVADATDLPASFRGFAAMCKSSLSLEDGPMLAKKFTEAAALIERLAAERDEARAERAKLAAKVVDLEDGLEHSNKWANLVEAQGLDHFDALAESWIEIDGIRRVRNAVASVFSKWANEDIMQRFRDHMDNTMKQAYVEGAIAGAANTISNAYERGKAEATALLAEAAGALEPFAIQALTLPRDEPDDDWRPWETHLPREAFRTARAVRDRIKGVGDE